MGFTEETQKLMWASKGNFLGGAIASLRISALQKILEQPYVPNFSICSGLCTYLKNQFYFYYS